MVPFRETITSQVDLINEVRKGYRAYSAHQITKNDFLMYFGFTHGEAIINFYGKNASNQQKLLTAGGFNTGSSAYFSAGINAWENLKNGIYMFPPISLPITKTLNFPLQIIFYGAPGTGKSHEIDGRTNDDNSIRTTFHPDTDYATFVGTYKPMMEEMEVRVVPVVLNNGAGFDQNNGTYKDKRIVYKYEPQVFLKAYVEAWKRYLNKQEGEDDNYYLVIEEINRGNCAQIFGDLFQLLDREDSGYSSYAISPESAITKYLAEDALSADGTKFSDLVFSDVIKKRKDGATKIIATADDLKAGKRLVLPPNLHIWATMNTSDQSLFPIDSAFKRRWDWKYVPIDYDKEAWSIVAKGEQYSWSDFLKKMNNLVAGATDSEDKMLGFYFAKARNGIIDADTFVGKVVFYLWNDVFKDYGLPKEILNGAESKEFAFRNFFMADGRANEDMVKRLLDNLGVAKPADTDFPVEGTEHQDEA